MASGLRERKFQVCSLDGWRNGGRRTETDCRVHMYNESKEPVAFRLVCHCHHAPTSPSSISIPRKFISVSVDCRVELLESESESASLSHSVSSYNVLPILQFYIVIGAVIRSG